MSAPKPIPFNELRAHIAKARKKLAKGVYPRTEVRALAQYQDDATRISMEAHDVYDGMYFVLSSATKIARMRDAKKGER